jgi:recombination protein RecA
MSVSQVMPVRKEVTFLVRKHKFPILATSGKFEMVTHPHAGLEIGQTDDAKAIKTFLTSLGQFNKGDKDGWVIFGDSYKTQGEWKSRLVCDPAYGFKVRQYIIKTMLETGELIEGDSDEK